MEKRLLQKLTFLVCGIVVLLITGCGSPVRQISSGGSYYLKNNFHYTTEKGKVKGSIANYTRMKGHEILPYGSTVKIESWNKGFKIVDEKSGRRIEVLAKKKWFAGMSLSRYIDLIISDTPVIYADLSEIDQKGISEGKPYKGMSKKGVMIALGYPCPHNTPSPDVNVWYYWKNRFAYYAVNFENGLVSSSGY